MVMYVEPTPGPTDVPTPVPSPIPTPGTLVETGLW